MHTVSVRNNALHDLTLYRMNIPHEHMFHICALRNIYIAVVYRHVHTIKYAYRKIIFTYIFRSLLLRSSGFLCKNAGKTNQQPTLHNTAITQYPTLHSTAISQYPTLHNTAISQYPKLSLSTSDIHRNIKTVYFCNLGSCYSLPVLLYSKLMIFAKATGTCRRRTVYDKSQ